MSKVDTFLNVVGKVLVFAFEQADKKAGVYQGKSYQQRKEVERMMNRSDLSEQQRQDLKRKSEMLDKRDEILGNYYATRGDLKQKIDDAYNAQYEKEKKIFEYDLRKFIRDQTIINSDYQFTDLMNNEDFIIIFVNNRLESEGEDLNLELAKKYALEMISEIDS